MQYINETLEEFAACFTGALLPEEDEDIAYADELNRQALDFSLGSLKVVDEYLKFLHRNRPEEMGRDWVNVISWGGAYVGEVIRTNSTRAYNWVEYDDWIREYPEHALSLGSEKRLETWAFLSPGEGSITLPLNKVFKFLFEGETESVWYYAFCELRRPDEN